MGQSSSRPIPPPADHQQPPEPVPRPRRRRPRPASAIFDSLRSHTSTNGQNENTSRSNRRSVHLPGISHFPWSERQQVRPRSPSEHDTPHTNRRLNRHNLTRTPTFARRLFHRHPHEDEPALDPSRRVPRDSLEMATTARNSQAQLPEGPPQLPDLGFDRPQSQASQQGPSGEQRPSTPRPNGGIADRISSLTPAREFGSRLTASIRRRRPRPMPPEDNAAMLQRLLSVAAAATAASLMGGNPESAVNDLRRAAVSVDTEDGSFDNFLQALRSGRLASHLGRNSSGGEANNEGTNGNGPNSLDFFRMFRFGPNRPPSSPRQEESIEHRDTNPSTAEGQADNDGEGRTVSILIVGIRSLNGENDAQPDQENAMPSFIDALSNLNTTINVGLQDPGSTPMVRPRNGLGLASLRSRRRASMGGMFAGRNLTRHPRLPEPGRPISELFSGSPSAHDHQDFPPLVPEASTPPVENTLSSLTGRSTPAEGEPANNNLITSNSPAPAAQPRPRIRDSWPSRNSWRNSWASRSSFNSRSRADTANASNRYSMVEPTLEEVDNEPPPRRTRPRSETDFLRFGSGSSRRNGIVEPDQPADTERNRSWIIYVLGGNYPENHPILTTPSLFTDNPTYEDMLLLSSLLGPAKPPIAQREDVDNAGGLFQFVDMGEKYVAQAVQEDGDDGYAERLVIEPTQNCLVCLSAYVLGEVARRLGSCGHLFHRECIDEVCEPIFVSRSVLTVK